jgi:6-phosphofructokinase 2
MVASGSVPPGIPSSIYYDIIMEAKSRGIRAAVDTVSQWLEEAIKAKPYLIKPNVREAEELLGMELSTEEEIVKAALQLVKVGIEIAVISWGKDGIIVATKENIFKAVAPPVKVRSAVGAGDCTVAGFALKLAYGEPPIEACRLAVAMGTAAVLTPGTELCHRADVERLLPQIKVWKMAPKEWAKTPFPAVSN